MLVLSAIPSKGNSPRNPRWTTLSTTIYYGNKRIRCVVNINRGFYEEEMREGINYYLGDNISEDGKEALSNGQKHTYYVDGIEVILSP
jgi:hypothetical protein